MTLILCLLAFNVCMLYVITTEIKTQNFSIRQRVSSDLHAHDIPSTQKWPLSSQISLPVVALHIKWLNFCFVWRLSLCMMVFLLCLFWDTLILYLGFVFFCSVVFYCYDYIVIVHSACVLWYPFSLNIVAVYYIISLWETFLLPARCLLQDGWGIFYNCMPYFDHLDCFLPSSWIITDKFWSKQHYAVFLVTFI